MKLWLLLVCMIIAAVTLILVLVEFATIYGGDWEHISSTIAGLILVITLLGTLIVMVKKR